MPTRCPFPAFPLLIRHLPSHPVSPNCLSSPTKTNVPSLQRLSSRSQLWSRAIKFLSIVLFFLSACPPTLQESIIDTLGKFYFRVCYPEVRSNISRNRTESCLSQSLLSIGNVPAGADCSSFAVRTSDCTIDTPVVGKQYTTTSLSCLPPILLSHSLSRPSFHNHSISSILSSNKIRESNSHRSLLLRFVASTLVHTENWQWAQDNNIMYSLSRALTQIKI